MFKIKLSISNPELDIDINVESDDLTEEQVLVWAENAIKASMFSMQGTIPVKYYYVNSAENFNKTNYPYGYKIPFIKALRSITGCGLKDGKDLVESNSTILKCKSYHYDAIVDYLNKNAPGYDFSKSTQCLPTAVKQDRKDQNRYSANHILSSYYNDDIFVPTPQFISMLGLPE